MGDRERARRAVERRLNMALRPGDGTHQDDNAQSLGVQVNVNVENATVILAPSEAGLDIGTIAEAAVNALMPKDKGHQGKTAATAEKETE